MPDQPDSVEVAPEPAIPGPSEFTIGVAAFAGTNKDTADQMSTDLATQIEASVEEYRKKGYSLAFAGPPLIGSVKPGQASDLASKFHLDLLVYGELNDNQLRPKLFIPKSVTDSYEGSFQQFAEMSGTHPFGLPLTNASLPIGGLGPDKAARDQVDGSVDAIVQIALAISWTTPAIPDYESALRPLQSASITLDRLDNSKSALAVVEHLRGIMTMLSNNWSDFSKASSHFDSALKADPSYKRPLLGLAEIDYLRGRGRCTSETADLARLLTAVHAYDLIADNAKADGDPTIGGTASLGKGRALRCLASSHDTSLMGDARTSLAIAITDDSADESGDDATSRSAHTEMALSYLWTGESVSPSSDELKLAELHARRSLALSKTDTKRATANALLGNILEAEGREADAEQAFRSAERQLSEFRSKKGKVEFVRNPTGGMLLSDLWNDDSGYRLESTVHYAPVREPENCSGLRMTEESVEWYQELELGICVDSAPHYLSIFAGRRRVLFKEIRVSTNITWIVPKDENADTLRVTLVPKASTTRSGPTGAPSVTFLDQTEDDDFPNELVFPLKENIARIIQPPVVERSVSRGSIAGFRAGPVNFEVTSATGELIYSARTANGALEWAPGPNIEAGRYIARAFQDSESVEMPFSIVASQSPHLTVEEPETTSPDEDTQIRVLLDGLLPFEAVRVDVLRVADTDESASAEELHQQGALRVLAGADGRSDTTLDLPSGLPDGEYCLALSGSGDCGAGVHSPQASFKVG